MQEINMRSSERGQIIVLLVLLLTALIGIAGVAVDGGRAYANARAAQNAVDNATLAGALALCKDQNVIAAVLASAAASGYDNNGTTNSITTYSPPSSGQYAGNPQYVEVILYSSEEPAFAQVVYAGNLEATVRAVSHCQSFSNSPAAGNGIVALDPDDDCAILANGNGSISVNGGGIFGNSNDSNGAMCATGNADVYAQNGIDLVGGWRTTGNAAINPIPNTGVDSISDPLAALDPPPNPGGSCTSYSLAANNSDTIDPGLYCSISLSGNADLVMNPGVYYIDNGDFDIAGTGSLVANGVMIYLTEGDFSITGEGDFTVTAPTTAPWAGMVLYVDRDTGGDITIAGNGDVLVGGTIYGANSHTMVSGNGTGTVLNAQFIVNTLNSAGNGDVTVNYNGDDLFQGGPGLSFISLAE